MKKQVKDWILLADNDLYATEIIMKDECPLTSIVAFHCQQSIEKYLKAYLIEKDITLVKTHDLIRLNDMIKEINDLGIDENKLIPINEEKRQKKAAYFLHKSLKISSFAV